jgi:hypothetical protein
MGAFMVCGVIGLIAVYIEDPQARMSGLAMDICIQGAAQTAYASAARCRTDRLWEMMHKSNDSGMVCSRSDEGTTVVTKGPCMFHDILMNPDNCGGAVTNMSALTNAPALERVKLCIKYTWGATVPDEVFSRTVQETYGPARSVYEKSFVTTMVNKCGVPFKRQNYHQLMRHASRVGGELAFPHDGWGVDGATAYTAALLQWDPDDYPIQGAGELHAYLNKHIGTQGVVRRVALGTQCVLRWSSETVNRRLLAMFGLSPNASPTKAQG